MVLTGPVPPPTALWVVPVGDVAGVGRHVLDVVEVGGNPEILPASAMVAHDDHAGIARLVAEQGLDPHSRPTLPAGWPDRAAMCAEVGEVYNAVAGRQ